MEKIPKIIHQIWSDTYRPLPEAYRILSDTWKEHHPGWQYILWNDDMTNDFVKKHYPQHWKTYNDFQFDIQRWDAVRYLILDTMGGMYVDFDSECLMPHDSLLSGKTCCFSMEPVEHGIVFNKELYFNNALMTCVPGHPFFKKIIGEVFGYANPGKEFSFGEKIIEILSTTGPLMLVSLYEEYEDKDGIYLIPAKYVSPLNKKEIKLITDGYESEELEEKIKDACSIHYFFNGWIQQ